MHEPQKNACMQPQLVPTQPPLYRGHWYESTPGATSEIIRSQNVVDGSQRRFGPQANVVAGGGAVHTFMMHGMPQHSMSLMHAPPMGAQMMPASGRSGHMSDPHVSSPALHVHDW
jgi:hypothetical protein